MKTVDNPHKDKILQRIKMMERLISFICLQESAEQLNLHYSVLQGLACKTKRAFTLLIMRNKILAS